MNMPVALRCRAGASGASARPLKVSSSSSRPVAMPLAMAASLPLKKAALLPLSHQHQRRSLIASPPTAVAAAAAASSGDSSTPAKKSSGFVADRVAELKALATPFSDPVSNGRLVALCLALLLCSVATLIHDT